MAFAKMAKNFLIQAGVISACLGARSLTFAIASDAYQVRLPVLMNLENEIEQGKYLRATSNSPRTQEELSCQNAYRKLSGRGSISISIMYGYNDQRPFTSVLDGDEKAILRSALLSPCRSPLERLCGFAEDSQGKLVKNLLDVDGRNLQIKINLTSSSVSDDDSANRTSFKDRQVQMSSDSRSEFARALREDDVVFYIGHARNGGGPDFSPPVLNSAGKVDFSRYQARKEGLSLMLANLSKSEHLKLLGVFACAADQHFARTLKKTRPEIGYLLAGEVTLPTQMNYALWGALQALLGQACEKAMVVGMTATSDGASKNASFTIGGFF